MLCQKHKTGVIVLTNALNSNPMQYVDQAYKLVLPEIIKATEAAKPKADPVWQNYVGDYISDWGAVKVVIRAEPGATVRRHITLPVGTLEETIQVICSAASLAPARPSAPGGSATPGAANRQAAGPRGSEPKIPSTFTGGIGGQIKVPRKLSHTNPVCPTGVPPDATVVRLAGRIGIDGLFTDLHDVSNMPAPYVASAMDAARQWVFTPTLLNGAPIEVNISVTVHYSWPN